MNKLYQKSEISFAVLWIVMYVVLSSVADQISESIGNSTRGISNVENQSRELQEMVIDVYKLSGQTKNSSEDLSQVVDQFVI